jgi:hemerythrin
MKDDEMEQMLVEIRAEVRWMKEFLSRYLDHHKDEHRDIKGKLEEHASYIDQQRGAKTALLAMAGFLAAFVSAVVQWVLKRINGA